VRRGRLNIVARLLDYERGHRPSAEGDATLISGEAAARQVDFAVGSDHAGLPTMPAVDAPAASIIIPVHGKWPYTLGCLRSLANSGDEHPFEVIVVDDRSPDDTPSRLPQVEGLRIVTTPVNLGFLGACNLGAGSARAPALVFLNNDTEVLGGWLHKLLAVLDEDPSVGLVGAMLVGEDGIVQESGGIIWEDGSGWNFGRGESVTSSAVRALRDVDYCSAAAFAVRRSLFEQLGGFDERYAPAYYEDTDLCFAVRDAGFRVVVQPQAVVVHREGGSHGTLD
jgi:O-antigen biosynthesis protein